MTATRATQRATSTTELADGNVTEKVIERFASIVIDRRLETPAIFFLEMNKPLSFLMGQSVLLASPLLAPLLGIENVQTLSALLSDRKNVERLMERIEELSTERSSEVME